MMHGQDRYSTKPCSPMREFNSPMKVAVFAKTPPKDDLLGQITVPLSDLDLSFDCVEKAQFTWKKRKRNGRIIGKMRVELGYVLVRTAALQFCVYHTRGTNTPVTDLKAWLAKYFGLMAEPIAKPLDGTVDLAL